MFRARFCFAQAVCALINKIISKCFLSSFEIVGNFNGNHNTIICCPLCLRILVMSTKCSKFPEDSLDSSGQLMRAAGIKHVTFALPNQGRICFHCSQIRTLELTHPAGIKLCVWGLERKSKIDTNTRLRRVETRRDNALTLGIREAVYHNTPKNNYTTYPSQPVILYQLNLSDTTFR